MQANCDYTAGFDCQGGGYMCITKLPEFFLENIVTHELNVDAIYKSLLDDGYGVHQPDPLHKTYPLAWKMCLC